MIFQGIGRVFSTEDQRQYETIGAFWDELARIYGRDNLRGLGYNWTENTIEYVIGLKEGVIEGGNCAVELPDSGWKTVREKTENLSLIYAAIYKDGSLAYEIETFTDAGDCEIQYWRQPEREKR